MSILAVLTCGFAASHAAVVIMRFVTSLVQVHGALSVSLRADGRKACSCTNGYCALSRLSHLARAYARLHALGYIRTIVPPVHIGQEGATLPRLPARMADAIVGVRDATAR